MKPVQYAFAAFAVLFVAACGSDTSSDTEPKCDADSTFAQIQQQIFDGRGCTASACHGEAANAGLDLRPESAYANLINVEATSGDYMRVFPGEQDLSALYQKVAAKTEGFELSALPNPISGGAMPTGNGACPPVRSGAHPMRRPRRGPHGPLRTCWQRGWQRGRQRQHHL